VILRGQDPTKNANPGWDGHCSGGPHKAVARRCYAARRVLRPEGALPTSRHAAMQESKDFPELVDSSLTDIEWQSVRLLLPSVLVCRLSM
jgi:hypothetical protein